MPGEAAEIDAFAPSARMPPLLIGVGDLHGHYPALETLLGSLHARYAIFEDRQAHRLRPGIELVFLGDYIDRGGQGRAVLDSVMALQSQNPLAVHPLLGNHELMALGDLEIAKDVLEAYRMMGNFGPLDEMLREYLHLSVHGSNGGTEFIREFGANGIAAFSAYTRRLSAGGDLGGWLRTLSPLRFSWLGGREILFVHGGLPPHLQTRAALEHYVAAFDVDEAASVADAQSRQVTEYDPAAAERASPFWNRDLRAMPPEEAFRLAHQLGVGYIVVGHTPQQRITNSHNIIFNVDAGMAPAYGHHEPAAIVFKEDGVYAFYARSGIEQVLVSHA